MCPATIGLHEPQTLTPVAADPHERNLPAVRRPVRQPRSIALWHMRELTQSRSVRPYAEEVYRHSRIAAVAGAECDLAVASGKGRSRRTGRDRANREHDNYGHDGANEASHVPSPRQRDAGTRDVPVPDRYV